MLDEYKHCPYCGAPIKGEVCTYCKAEFYKKEDNPLFYLFIIPKLVKSEPEKVKQDQELMNLINFIEENTKGLNIKVLEKKYSPITFMNLFATDTVKKNAIEYS